MCVCVYLSCVCLSYSSTCPTEERLSGEQRVALERQLIRRKQAQGVGLCGLTFQCRGLGDLGLDLLFLFYVVRCRTCGKGVCCWGLRASEGLLTELRRFVSSFQVL